MPLRAPVNAKLSIAYVGIERQLPLEFRPLMWPKKLPLDPPSKILLVRPLPYHPIASRSAMGGHFAIVGNQIPEFPI
jgi:hypothetical protein